MFHQPKLLVAIDSIPEGYRKITARQMYEIESKDRSFAWTKVLPKSVLRMPVPHPEREGNIQFGSLLALAQRNMRSEGHYHMLRLPPAFWKCAKKAGNDEHFFVAAGNSISMWDIGHYRKETDSIKRTMAALRSNRQLFDMFWKLISTPDYSISQISMPGRTAHLDAHLNELFGRTIFQMADVGCAANAEDYPAISTIETKKNCPSAVLTAVDIHNPKDIKPALENHALSHE